jgi:hypothetical protein
LEEGNLYITSALPDGKKEVTSPAAEKTHLLRIEPEKIELNENTIKNYRG